MSIYNWGIKALRFFEKATESKAETFSRRWKEQLNSRNTLTSTGNSELIGASGLILSETSAGTTGTNKANDALKNDANSSIDLTSYPDKAIIKLYNGRGFDVYLLALTIRGKPIIRYSGADGGLIHDKLKRDDDIRRNGETVFELGNNYIVDATQCATLADYWFKFLGKKRHIYQVTIAGLCPWFSMGDWYMLAVGAAGMNEYINSTVECYSMQCECSAGDVGQTVALFREVEENWQKTTFYTARALLGASPKRRSNQSNTLIVAASNFDGTYNYICDGTADNVEIQAAIDYIATMGGGEVILTAGTYTIAATITMKPGVWLYGAGSGTILKPSANTVFTIIDWGTATQATCSDFIIDGDGTNITFTTSGTIVDGQLLGRCHNITIQNYAISGTTGSVLVLAFKELIFSINCSVTNNTTSNSGTGAYFYPFSNCTNLSSCSSSGNSTTGAGAFIFPFHVCTNLSSCSSSGNSTTGDNANIYSFNACTNLSSCNSSGNSTTGASADIFSFNACTNLSSCSSSGNSTTGASAHIFSFHACTNLSSCNSSGNSTTGASANIYSFNYCKRLSVCSTASNSSSLSIEYGYDNCNSVQQCNSTDDSNPYTASYADAGTTNACADTSSGGYNS